MTLKVAFFGLPLAALLLRNDGHDIVYAGVCRKGALGTRRLRRALGDRVQIVPRLTDPRVFERIAKTKPDLVVSWFWTKKIPPRITELAPMGSVGVHPSLLPRHRGPDPYFWTIFEGDAQAGVTAHRLEDEYDTGAILGSRTLAVDPSWNAWTLAKRLDRPSLALLRDTVDAFAGRHGKAPPRETKQDESRATPAPSPTDDDLRLDAKHQTAAALERLVRAAGPYPGAWLELEAPDAADDGEVVVITRAAVVQAVPRAIEPGEACVVGGRAVLRAKDVGLALLGGRLLADDPSPADPNGADAGAEASERGGPGAEIELSEADLADLVARLSGRARLE